MPRSTKDTEKKKETKKIKKVVDDTDKKSAKKKDTSKIITKSKSTKNTSTSKSKKNTSTTSSVSTKTVTTKSRTRKSTSKKDIVTNLEYYDLPYRYNQTIVTILSQTPNTLFIYWDISDTDRKNLEEIYGNEFFYITKPVLIIHNETKNYSFEIDINDFANSWYLNLSDTDCKYSVELGRRFLENNNQIESYNFTSNEYIYISSSNKLITPNDHILLNFNNVAQFKNIKTNNYFNKNISFINQDFYKNVYSKEILEDLPFNPSSKFI